jgi:hypothetical protein
MNLFLGETMKRFVMSAFAACAVSGCSGLDPSKLLPSAASAFQTSIGNRTAMEGRLVTAWRDENRSLLYLSAGDYSCGDPKSALAKLYATSKDPGTLISEQHVNKYWTSSFNYVGAYVKLLKEIAAGAAADQAKIKEAVALGSLAAKYVPDISATAAASALSALGTIASDARGVFGVLEINQAARDAKRPLEIAVGHLKKYYPQFAKFEQEAYNAWDECANEKLLFIRDQPLGKIPTYRKSYFTVATGTDLDAAHAQYLAQRQTFILDGSVKSIEKTLDQILLENDRLANPQLTWESLQTAAQTLDTLYKDAVGAADAVEKFGTSSKPVAAPKSGGSASIRSGVAATAFALMQ